jgi:hypothetical protein
MGRNRMRRPHAVRYLGALAVAGVTGLLLMAGAQARVKAAGNAFPAHLVGTWGFAVATGNYCNPLGRCAPGSGGSQSFTFTADGNATFAKLESALVDGCGEIRTFIRTAGPAIVNGATIVFSPRSGAYVAANGCRPDLTGTWNIEPKDLTTVSMRWELVGGGRKALRLTDPKGEVSGIYSRR